MDKHWTFSLKHPNAILRHFLLWIVLYIGFTLLINKYGDFSKYFAVNLLNASLFAAAYYTLRFWQVPHLYRKGKPFLFLLSLVISGFIAYCIYWLTRYYVVDRLFDFTIFNPFKYPGEYLVRVLRFYSPAIVLLVWEFQFDKKLDATRNQLLEQDKIATELQFLKAQINPHFLFNTLNNLYSFVVNESPQAVGMIDRLTGILDYALNKSQSAKVPVKDEIEAIEHYLELEKIRYGERLQIGYNSVGNMKARVSPLIILSIIENAFKHGASGDVDQPKIKIEILAEDNAIKCLVWNTKSKHVGELNDEYKSGIGLSNIKRQLNLIYPEQHTLDIRDGESDFTVSLNINNAA